MKTQLAVPLAFCLTLIAPVSQAQEQPIAAPLLRRLAEVADAYRTGKPVYIVASTNPPYDVRAVFFDPKTAADSASGSYHVFGPYVTQPDAVAQKATEVLSITVKIRTAKDTVSVTVNPKQYDALFWTAPAIDKFLVPYYSRVYGADRAAALHNQYVRSAMIIWGHMLRTIADSLPLPRY